MPSLADLFNPSFLMFLGILVLVVALLVVYFESKLREQNHKITSMFSIVSTLAEDMNGMKMGINQLMHYNNTIGGSVQAQQQPFVPYEQNTKFIEVSDDVIKLQVTLNFPIRRISKDSEDHLISISKNIWLTGCSSIKVVMVVNIYSKSKTICFILGNVVMDNEYY
jgi:uncharacterized protein YoxC